MAAAARAQDLRAPHEVAAVGLLLDRLLIRRRREGRPATARVVLRVRGEQLRPAACTRVGARVERVVVLAAERALRALLSEHVYVSGVRFAPPSASGFR